VVTGVDESNPNHDFTLVTTGGISGASITSVSGSGSVYTVTISGITGRGTLGLNLVDDGTIRDLAGNHMAEFQNQTTFAAGSDPTCVAAADVNRDGKPDLVIANFFDNTVSVLLGNGDGTFQNQTTFATGSFPRSVAVADVNGDGKPDLVVANFYGPTVSVLLGNGDGTFQNPTTFATGSYPNSVAVADVNRDGTPDLVVANAVDNTVGVLLGNGDGTFQNQTTFATGLNPTSVAVADVNRDGKPDLVVANLYDETVGVLLGNGDGTFQNQTTFATGPYPNSVAVADVNRDGKPDLVVANFNGNTVSVLLGNGDGTFQNQATFATGSNPNSVAVVDVNRDGKPDLVVANLYANTMGVLLGNGDGTFQSQTPFDTGLYPNFVAVADVNRDGTPDLIVANSGGNTVSVILNNANGNFTGQVYTIANPPVISLTVGAGGPSYTATWYNSGPVPIENMAQASVTDANSPTIASMTIAVTTFHTGDVLQVPILASNVAIVPVYNGAGTLTLTGTATLAQYSQELRLVNYSNTAGGPGTTPITATFVANDGAVSSTPVTATINVSVASGQVLGNRLFYNNSKYDANSALINASDDNAIASDKVGFNGSGTATFANVSSATRGITGVMVDLASGLGTHTNINLTSGDITFKVAPAFSGTYNQLSTWTTFISQTAISVRLGAGTGGSDRLEVTFANNAIKNTWLEVNVAANANTGLSTPDIFYFGSAAGDSGLGDSAALAKVDINDANPPNANVLGLTTQVFQILDYTKDGKVDINDTNAAASGIFTLRYLANPTGPFAPDGGGAAAPAAVATASAMPAESTTSANSAVSTGLSLLNSLPTNPPTWLAGRLQNILGSQPVATIFQNAQQGNQVLQTIDQVAANYHLTDDMLDGLLADLGLAS
jgi:hypothetical protein